MSAAQAAWQEEKQGSDARWAKAAGACVRGRSVGKSKLTYICARTVFFLDLPDGVCVYIPIHPCTVYPMAVSDPRKPLDTTPSAWMWQQRSSSSRNTNKLTIFPHNTARQQELEAALASAETALADARERGGNREEMEGRLRMVRTWDGWMDCVST